MNPLKYAQSYWYWLGPIGVFCCLRDNMRTTKAKLWLSYRARWQVRR